MRVRLQRKRRHALAGAGENYKSGDLAGLMEVKGVINMQRCACTTTKHDNHSGIACDKPATAVNAYCIECLDKKAKEHAVTKPYMLTYQSR